MLYPKILEEELKILESRMKESIFYIINSLYALNSKMPSLKEICNYYFQSETKVVLNKKCSFSKEQKVKIKNRIILEYKQYNNYKVHNGWVYPEKK